MASSIPPRPPTGGPTAHIPRAVMVMAEPLPGGRLRLSTPHARGWATVVRTPIELARGMQTAINEVQVAAYARAREQVYDLDALTPQVVGDPLAGRPMTRETKPRRSRRSHHPGDWKMVDNGSWRSPGGRVYRSGTKIVNKVVAAREALGLPVT